MPALDGHPAPTSPPAPGFTAAERDLIRREFMVRFGSARSVTEGLLLRRWATGPRKGQVKVPAGVQGLLDRGLVTVHEPERGFPAARFTPAGFQALRALAADTRALDPARFRHLIEELAGLPPP